MVIAKAKSIVPIVVAEAYSYFRHREDVPAAMAPENAKSAKAVEADSTNQKIPW